MGKPRQQRRSVMASKGADAYEVSLAGDKRSMSEEAEAERQRHGIAWWGTRL